MAKSKSHAPADFSWQPQPKAAALVKELAQRVLETCPGAANLAARMRHDTATRFIDWIDSIQVKRTDQLKSRLLEVGFVRRPVPAAPDHYVHEGALFPQIVLAPSANTRVTIKVDSVVDFLAAWHIADDPTTTSDDIEGDPWAVMRRARAFRSDQSELWVIERHGYRGFAVPDSDSEHALNMLRHLESFRRRARDWDDDEVGFDHTEHLVDAAVADLGMDAACDLFFVSERQYWQSRNRAAQIQKTRQDRIGLGWANHDHHTYRSSRRYFHRLIRLLHKLGFVHRERFYAGAEAGWGAQVLEQPVAGITIFADVDLSPEELSADFANDVLPERAELGTVGLWCGLHGEAMLQAGMHHLECQFDFEALVDQLEAASVKTMDPFTTLPHLRQAFTEGERWPVTEKRLTRLTQSGMISPAHAQMFRMQGGAIGSHLENLQREDGYKGFNQKGISHIITKTDPRKQPAAAGAGVSPELIGA